MLVVPAHRKLVMDTPSYQQVAAVIPHAKAFTHGGQNLLALHHGVEESLVLKNFGFSVPAPILSYYDWPARFTAMDHQKETAAFLTMNKRALVLNAPGTGKTISSIWAADFLLTEGIAKKVCIFVLVGIANIIDTQILQNGAAIRTAVVFFYLANEGLSCLENAAVIGLPVPEKLKEMLAQLKDERNQDKIDKQ